MKRIFSAMGILLLSLSCAQKPEYLFLANHGSREAGFFLKIENWK